MNFGGFLNSSLGSGLASSIGGALVGGAFGLAGQKLQTKQEKELMQYQFDLQKQMFDYQAAYNSPSAQMGRLRAAGLNPNLVYGNGSVVNTNTATGGVGKGNGSNPFAGLGSAFMALMANMFRTANIDADTRNKKAAAELARSQAGYYSVLQAKADVERAGIEWDNYRKSIEMDYLPEYLQGRNDLQFTNYRKAATEIGLLIDQSEQIQANIQLMKSRKNLTDEQATTEIVKRVVMGQQVRLMASQIGLNEKQVEKMGYEIIKLTKESTKLDLGNGLQRLMTKWREDYGFSDDQISGIAKTIMNQVDKVVTSISDGDFGWW